MYFGAAIAMANTRLSKLYPNKEIESYCCLIGGCRTLEIMLALANQKDNQLNNL